jgi:HEAT repeat protein
MTTGDELSPAMAGRDELADCSLSPTLGTAAITRRRPWWNNLKGPIAVLLPDLTDASPRLRRRAAEALARLGDRRAAPALALGLRDRTWEVRLACLEALLHLRADGLGEVLARGTLDGHPRVRLAAADALLVLGDARGIAPLEALEKYLSASGQETDRRRVLATLDALRAKFPL